MHISDFDFDLPPELIAQDPAAERSAARLLHLDRESGSMVHSTVAALPDHLRAGDLVVVNNTRVCPARLLAHRVPSGGAVECLLVRRTARTAKGSDPGSDPSSELWEALMHPGQKLKPGARVVFERVRRLHGEVQEQHYFGRRVITLWTDDESTVDEAIDAIGHVPLPPYIKRDDRQEDRDRYQTVFAQRRGSAAGPTRGPP